MRHAEKQVRHRRFNLVTYWMHHRHALQHGLRQLTKNPLQALLTIAVLSITLVLPTVLFLILSNAQNLTQGWQNSSNIAVYLPAQANSEQISEVQQALQKMSGIKKFNYISPDQGLTEFAQQSGLSNIAGSLGFNPLPPVFIIQPTEKSPAAINMLMGQLNTLPHIGSIKINMQWVERLNAIIEFLQRLTYGLAILLALGLLLIVGNTIRLAVQNYHTEIEVIKLVGGTDRFIRRPFLYSGIFYGLASGLFAALILDFLLLWLQGPINQLTDLFNTQFFLQGLTFDQTLLLLLCSTLLGYLGSWLAVGRRLKQIQMSKI